MKGRDIAALIQGDYVTEHLWTELEQAHREGREDDAWALRELYEVVSDAMASYTEYVAWKSGQRRELVRHTVNEGTNWRKVDRLNEVTRVDAPEGIQ